MKVNGRDTAVVLSSAVANVTPVGLVRFSVSYLTLLTLYAAPDVSAPYAVSDVLPPGHTEVGVSDAIAVTDVPTTTDLVAVAEQPALLVPVAVYVAELPAVKVTDAPVVADRLVAGDQVYVAPPDAVSDSVLPVVVVAQIIAVDGEMEMVGSAFTVTVRSVQQPVAVTVYRIFAVPGDKAVINPVEALTLAIPEASVLHVPAPPDDVQVVEPFTQRDVVLPDSTGVLFVTVTLAWA